MDFKLKFTFDDILSSSVDIDDVHTRLMAGERFFGTPRMPTSDSPEDDSACSGSRSSNKRPVALLELRSYLQSIMTGIDKEVQSLKRHSQTDILTVDSLADMKIRAGPNLELKHDWKLRSRAATLLAASHTLSSSGFHKHLEMLTTLMERSTNPSRGRTLFEAFLWRASVMQPPHLPVVVAPGTSHIIPTAAAPAEPNSFITASLECQEYTAYIARGTENAKCIRSGSSPHTGDKLESKVRMFLVDSGNSQLRDCTPYIVSSLHASGDGYIRGVLSNGFEYIFIELLRNENNEGATYRVSGSFTFQIQPSSLLGETADEISGVLASWFLNSKEPTSASSDDWLSPCIGIGDAD